MNWLAKRPWLMLVIGILIANGVKTLAAEELTVTTTASSAKSLEPNGDAAKIFAGGIPQSVADLKRMEAAQKKLAEKIAPVTVNLRLGQAQGSGVIVSADGFVLTAAHVAHKPNLEIFVTFPDGKVVRGKTLGLFRTMDAGLVKIDGNGPWPFAEMEQNGLVKEGQWCVATGHPGGFEPGRQPVLRVGRVLAINDTSDTSVIVTDCTLVGGDSGGPLFNADGRVIGVHSRIGNPLTANMHVPIKAYRDTWDRMVKAESWGHLPGQIPYIGVRGDNDSTIAKVTQVFVDTPAEKAGIKVGDVIQKFDGQAITDFASLSTMVSGRQPGERVKLEVKRGDETMEISVVIGKRGG